MLRIVDDTPLQARVCFRDLALGVYLSGRHKIRRQIGNSVVEGWSDPGTINLTPPGVEGTWEATASSRAAVVVIRPEFISRAIDEHWGADRAKLRSKAVPGSRSRHRSNNIESGTRSRRWLFGRTALCGECLRIPRPSSDLSLFQPVPNIHRDPWAAFQVAGSNSFSNTLRTRSVSRSDCASWLRLPGISARHFERAFRQSTGSSPHGLRNRTGGCTGRATC